MVEKLLRIFGIEAGQQPRAELPGASPLCSGHGRSVAEGRDGPAKLVGGNTELGGFPLPWAIPTA